MGVFDNCFVLLELKNVPLKEKKKLKSAVTMNGGSFSFIVNKQCSLVVTTDVSNLSSNRLRSIQKHQTPVVGLNYLHDCVERGALLPVDGYQMDTASAASSPAPPPVQLASRAPLAAEAAQQTKERKDEKLRIFHESDSDLPAFPDDFQVALYSFFGQDNGSTWCVLELQSAADEEGRRYRVARYWQDDVAAKKAAVMDRLVFPSTSDKAVDVYQQLTEELQHSDLQLKGDVPAEVQPLGSAPLQQLLLENKLNSSTLSPEVALFVEMLWTEALGCLGNILRVPISQLSLNDVSRAEGLLLQAQRKLKEGNPSEASSLLEEVYTLLPHKDARPPFPTAKLLSQKLDLCQLIRDFLNVTEMTCSTPSSVGKYRSLRCSIEAVPPSSAEFQNISALLADRPAEIQQILRVSRGVELQTFRSELRNIKPLLHSSSPRNFVGILSRGLLLPHVGVELHGIERTDVGNLGSGIYFSDALSTSLKYSSPSETDGSRLLLVCDVALGWFKNVYKKDPTLTRPPEGFHSVHGVRRTKGTPSDFEDDEFVVYSPDQVKIKYVVQFRVKGDQQKPFSPDINLTADAGVPRQMFPSSNYEDLEKIKNPLEDVTAGLLNSSGEQLPLQAVNVKCKLIDLLSQVVIFQKYTNHSSAPIEAKYVFPLDDLAAVCGFEAFINGKHVVGQVKEKQTARREYKQAIAKGHGAYLMDQEAPDVFTISVGNLPPGATVLIKVTFLSELVVRDGSILFSLPGSVAPWQESSALNQTTQVSVQKVCVTDEASREFTLDMSVEMPNEISSLTCITHQVKIKRTQCQAVVSVMPGQLMGPDGFQLSVSLSEVHLPRMWVEKHPDKDSQACMLVFYPDFQVDYSSGVSEVVILLDSSESMRDKSFHLAKEIALQVLKNLKDNVRINIFLFGTVYQRAFQKAEQLPEADDKAEMFIKSSCPLGGGTELWRPLQALSLLPPSSGVRNLLLLSDGHIQNAAVTLQLLRDNVKHSRLFTCGLSSTANRHMLRALAQAGGGAYEFFDAKTKHTWAEKVKHQVKRMLSPGCSSVSVKWQQFNSRAPPPLQSPKQLHALFNDCHTLVYGFVPHCTQATLLGDVRGQELRTMVSTTELQKTRGTFLHKLTARALIRDYEDGSLDATEAEHEGKKAELKSFIIDLSKEYSILSQFTSFVAIEERDSEKAEDGVTDVPKLIADEDVDFLPYISWTLPQEKQTAEIDSIEEDEVELEGAELSDDESVDDMGFGLFDDDPAETTTMKKKSARSQHTRRNLVAQLKTIYGAPHTCALRRLPPRDINAESVTAIHADLQPPAESSSDVRPAAPTRSSSSAGFSPDIVYGGVQGPGPVTFRSRRVVPFGATDAAPPPPASFQSRAETFGALPPPPCSITVRKHMGLIDQSAGFQSSFGLSGTASPFLSASQNRATAIYEKLQIQAGMSAAAPPPPASIRPLETDRMSEASLPPKHGRRSPMLGAPLRRRMESRMFEAPPPSALHIMDPHSGVAEEPMQVDPSPLESREPDPEELRLKWTKIFQLQNPDGYWELTAELGGLIDLNVDVFANVFLKNRGIHSLGVKAHANILKLVATLLVLQLMRVEKLEEGKLLQSLFCLKEPSESRPERWQQVKKAVDWVCWADREYPCICSRLEFGWSWESSTRQLLGFDRFPPFSPLSSLNLQRTSALLQVH
ncbi:protein mono-ADP-ribosyltransferase PARP4 isoform X3 [Cyprinodon tularosa]|uniref:protein mono-ADP-ribosyltransferase PARP4 isoform X3 n=1 Tax=Cyprinodon tularosa TaxID=77115 RepID=UPI0018E27CBB|nr:protein mono-ADP-ribosyltransferase PARP4 isoform X3 [Cyprinodon tularosa]